MSKYTSKQTGFVVFELLVITIVAIILAVLSWLAYERVVKRALTHNTTNTADNVAGATLMASKVFDQLAVQDPGIKWDAPKRVVDMQYGTYNAKQSGYTYNGTKIVGSLDASATSMEPLSLSGDGWQSDDGNQAASGVGGGSRGYVRSAGKQIQIMNVGIENQTQSDAIGANGPDADVRCPCTYVFSLFISDPFTDTETTRLSGTVAAGPTQPTCSVNSSCSSPVTFHTIQAINSSGIIAGATKTDYQGNYTMQLPSGSYSLKLVPSIGIGDRLYPVIVSGGAVNFDISADTGIR